MGAGQLQAPIQNPDVLISVQADAGQPPIPILQIKGLGGLRQALPAAGFLRLLLRHAQAEGAEALPGTDLIGLPQPAQLGEEKAVGVVPVGPAGEHACIRALEGTGYLEALQCKVWMPVKKRPHHVLILPLQQGAGGVEEHAARTDAAVAVQAARPDIPGHVVQNGGLHLWQVLQGLRGLVADVRLFADNTQA